MIMLNNMPLKIIINKKSEDVESYDLRFFICISYFSNNGSHDFLLFQSSFNTFAIPPVDVTETIVEWESK